MGTVLRFTTSEYPSVVYQLLFSKFEIITFALVNLGAAQHHAFSFHHYAALTIEVYVPLSNLKKYNIVHLKSTVKPVYKGLSMQPENVPFI